MTSNTKSVESSKASAVNMKQAYFAGGCFWCMEGIFEAQKGVAESISGYLWGNKEFSKLFQ